MNNVIIVELKKEMVWYGYFDSQVDMSILCRDALLEKLPLSFVLCSVGKGADEFFLAIYGIW